MKTFYETIDGKEKTWKPSKEEFKEYEDVCLTIWGALPYDITWAKGTSIYQKKLTEIKLLTLTDEAQKLNLGY